MDTPRYRIGNDLTIFWAINNRDGSPYDLDGKEVRLFMTHERGREEVEAQITKLTDGIRNNVIRWDFKAEDQRILGKYTLTFVVLESDTHRELTKDYGEAFTLVGRSEMESEEGDANISIGGDLILSTKLDIYRIQATNVDVAGLKNQIYDVEKGLTTKVGREEFDTKTGQLHNQYVKVETTLEGVTTEIKDVSGEMTQIKQTIDGIEVSIGDIEYKVESLEKQTDGAIEKWFYPGAPGPDVLPESNWKTDQEKYSHLGDLYYDENTGIAYRYISKDNQYLWVVIEDADIVAALEAAKNNNRTFIDQPKTPYKVGDLWIAEKNYEESGIKQDDIVVCIVTREEGQFDINDWQKKGNAINDEDLENFVDKYYEEVILPEIGKQIDGQAASYYGPDDPSLEWEAGTEADHKGDLWFNTNNNQAYFWSGSEWVESEVPEEIFDKIDGKNTIFVSIPEGKDYKENDLWFVEKDYNLDGFEHRKGVILVALEDALFDEATQSYQFKYADWVRRDTYTDDTAVANLDEYIKTGFKNGILDESEKRAIESAWDSIVLAQEQLTQDYQTVILPGFTLPEYTDLQKAYKAVYNDQPSTEYPNRGTFQLLGDAVTAILNYVVTEEESTLPALIEAYDNAYDAYRTALSNYTIAYGKFTNAIRAELGQANEYIEAIIDDGKLTPIEKKQLLEVYKSLAAEYSSNVDTAFTAKIWKYNDAGNEVPGAYAGPKGVGQEYFDTYVAYKEAYSPILAVFTGSDWGFDEMDETTKFKESINLSQLDAYFDVYYEALRAMARVISVVAEEKAEASLAMKEYMDDLEEVLTPTEAITQVGKGVVLSSIIGVGTYDEQTGKYLLKAGMNATAKDTADLITVGEHGRIVFVGGANGKKDWNQATYVVYEDGYVHFRAGKIDKEVQIGEAVIQSVIADQINLLSWPEYDEATGQTKLTPLFSVNTEKDTNGRDKIVSISALYDMYVGGNLIVRGDTSSTAKGTDAGVAGTLLGIKVNGQTYDKPVNGILTIPDYPTSLEWSAINGKPTKLTEFTNDAGFITSAALNGYAKTSDLPTKTSLGLGNVENKSSATIRGEITSANVTNALGYTPLSTAGGTLTASKREVLYLNTTAAYCDLTLQINKVDKAVLSYDATHGVYVYNYPSGKYIGVKDDGTPYYNNGSYNTLYHTGNFNPANYLPLSGGTINGTTTDPIIVNTSATSVGIRLQINKANKAYVGYGSSVGAYLYNYDTGAYIGVDTSGSPFYHNGTIKNTLIHSGNIGSQKVERARYIETQAYDGSKWYADEYRLYAKWSASNILGLEVEGGYPIRVNQATKLETARTIWGQSFDGTGNVSGALSGVTNINGAITINSSGNVLIGTTTDSGYKLDVNGTAYATYFRTATISIDCDADGVGGNHWGEINRFASSLYVQNRTGNLYLSHSAGTTYIRGLASIAGAVTMSSTLSVTSGVTSTKFLTNGNYGIWRGSSYTSAMTANDIAFYADNFRFDCGSNFVKTLEIKEKLVTISGNAIITRDISTGSDIRFKDKITDHLIAFSDIAEAPLFTFKWNDREDDSVHLGSSAQYWEKVAPWLVKGEDFKTLDYSTLGVAIGISLANKAVNHEERIKILEKENKALKEQIRRIQHGS